MVQKNAMQMATLYHNPYASGRETVSDLQRSETPLQPRLGGYHEIHEESVKDLEEEVERLEDEPLSTKQVKYLLNGKVNYVPYSEVKNYRSIDELIGEYNCCILLYFTAENFGHYVCLTKRDNEIEFFDPYGLMIDDELEFLGDDEEDLKERKNQNYGYLTELLLDSPYKLIFNQYQFQKEKDDINTCGRHCAVRCSMKKLDLEQYRKFIKNNIKLVKKTTGRKDIDADFIVTMYTSQV